MFQKYFQTASCGLLCALLAGGCVKRKETLVVHEDGSVHIRIENEGDREDMENGAPPLARKTGWEFGQELEVDDDGKESIRRWASRTIPAGEPIPDADPVDDESLRPLILQHPTSLTIERRRDGVYHHFHRIYPSRPWAYVVYWRDHLIEQPLEHTDEKDLQKMSPDKKQELVQNLIHFEGKRDLIFFRRASQSLTPKLAQDEWLDLRSAVADVLKAVDTDEVLALLEQHHEEEKNERNGDDPFAAKADEIHAAITTAALRALRQRGRPDAYIREFSEAFERQRRMFTITEDYEDEEWEVYVQMPGEIVAHNGDSEDGGTVKWTFEGKTFFDREHELMVTSRVVAPK